MATRRRKKTSTKAKARTKPKGPHVLTLDEMLDVPVRKVTTPRGIAFVRKPSARDFADYHALANRKGTPEGPGVDGDTFEELAAFELVARCLCDEHGSLLFGRGEVRMPDGHVISPAAVKVRNMASDVYIALISDLFELLGLADVGAAKNA